MHGLGASWRSWAPILDLLAVHREVIAIDLPGFGDSPPLPGEVVGSAERNRRSHPPAHWFLRSDTVTGGHPRDRPMALQDLGHWVRLAAAVVLRRARVPHMTTMRGSRISIVSERPRPRQLDGDRHRTRRQPDSHSPPRRYPGVRHTARLLIRLLQSAISLVTVALVLAWALSILG